MGREGRLNAARTRSHAGQTRASGCNRGRHRSCARRARPITTPQKDRQSKQTRDSWWDVHSECAEHGGHSGRLLLSEMPEAHDGHRNAGSWPVVSDRRWAHKPRPGLCCPCPGAGVGGRVSFCTSGHAHRRQDSRLSRMEVPPGRGAREAVWPTVWSDEGGSGPQGLKSPGGEARV